MVPPFLEIPQRCYREILRAGGIHHHPSMRGRSADSLFLQVNAIELMQI
jgi:hypothetical protein